MSLAEHLTFACLILSVVFLSITCIFLGLTIGNMSQRITYLERRVYKLEPDQ
jgi:hypothetical protein